MGLAIGTWPRLDGAPEPTSVDSKSYDKKRRKMAHFLGMDFLFTQREFCQSIQTDDQGCKVLVNSSKTGEILAVRPVPEHLMDKVWFKRKLRFPRSYLGIPKIDERVGKLSYLVHALTQYGIPSRAVLKSLNRLSLTWMFTKYEDMRKHVHSITRKVIARSEKTRNLWKPKKGLSKTPCFHGEKRHANGIIAPLWSWNPPRKKGSVVLETAQLV
jgi:hypothetical protein